MPTGRAFSALFALLLLVPAVTPAPALAQASLTGAGATFPFPLYSNWFATWAARSGVRINYQSIGSGGGIRQFTKGTVDFGATDAPMKDDQMAAVAGNVLHIPTVIGSVALTVNLPTLAGRRLRLDAATIAAIYLGHITSWQDPRLRTLNPGVRFPDLDIVVVHRSDGSGTTYVFSDYLSKVSAEWAREVGRGTAVRWPAGLGGKGNEGVTAQVKLLEGSIGYVETGYAIANGLPFAEVRNAAGQWMVPTLESATAAAMSVDWRPESDFRVSITDAAAPGAYPITSLTWLLIYRDNPDTRAARELRDFLAWMISPEAQEQARQLHYAPLPPAILQLVRDRIGSLRAAGRPIP